MHLGEKNNYVKKIKLEKNHLGYFVCFIIAFGYLYHFPDDHGTSGIESDGGACESQDRLCFDAFAMHFGIIDYDDSDFH